MSHRRTQPSKPAFRDVNGYSNDPYATYGPGRVKPGCSTLPKGLDDPKNTFDADGVQFQRVSTERSTLWELPAHIARDVNAISQRVFVTGLFAGQETPAVQQSILSRLQEATELASGGHAAVEPSTIMVDRTTGLTHITVCGRSDPVAATCERLHMKTFIDATSVTFALNVDTLSAVTLPNIGRQIGLWDGGRCRIQSVDFRRIKLSDVSPRADWSRIDNDPQCVTVRLFFGHLPFEVQHGLYDQLGAVVEWFSDGQVIVVAWDAHGRPTDHIDRGCAKLFLRGPPDAVDAVRQEMNDRVFLLDSESFVVASGNTGDHRGARVPETGETVPQKFARQLAQLVAPFVNPAAVVFPKGQRLVVEEAHSVQRRGPTMW